MTANSLRWMVLLIGLLLGAAPVRAQEPAKPKRADHALTSGPALAIGVATEVVFVGGQLLYYWQLSPRWRIAVHLGAGGLPAENEGGRSWGIAGGTFAAFGVHHRLVVGLQAGTRSWETLRLHGETVDRRQTPGAGLGVGWEWISSFGLSVRGTIGPGFYVSPETPLGERCASFALMGGWLLGYKLW